MGIFDSRCLTGSVLLLSMALPAQAEVYKWVDEQGRTHYSSDKADAERAKGSEVKIRDPARTNVEDRSYWEYLRNTGRTAATPTPTPEPSRDEALTPPDAVRQRTRRRLGPGQMQYRPRRAQRRAEVEKWRVHWRVRTQDRGRRHPPPLPLTSPPAPYPAATNKPSATATTPTGGLNHQPATPERVIDAKP
jgi:hypothetical protein